MTTQQAIDIPPDFREWAVRKLAKDDNYVRHRAAFGPEPLRSIAKLILQAADAQK